MNFITSINDRKLAEPQPAMNDSFLFAHMLIIFIAEMHNLLLKLVWCIALPSIFQILVSQRCAYGDEKNQHGNRQRAKKKTCQIIIASHNLCVAFFSVHYSEGGTARLSEVTFKLNQYRSKPPPSQQSSDHRASVTSENRNHDNRYGLLYRIDHDRIA